MDPRTVVEEMSVVESLPKYALICLDHPHKSVATVPGILSKKFNIKVIGFFDKEAAGLGAAAAKMGAAYYLVPPMSGPAVERMINKVNLDEVRLAESQQKNLRKKKSTQAGAKEEVIQIKGGRQSQNALTTTKPERLRFKEAPPEPEGVKKKSLIFMERQRGDEIEAPKSEKKETGDATTDWWSPEAPDDPRAEEPEQTEAEEESQPTAKPLTKAEAALEAFDILHASELDAAGSEDSEEDISDEGPRGAAAEKRARGADSDLGSSQPPETADGVEAGANSPKGWDPSPQERARSETGERGLSYKPPVRAQKNDIDLALDFDKPERPKAAEAAPMDLDAPWVDIAAADVEREKAAAAEAADSQGKDAKREAALAKLRAAIKRKKTEAEQDPESEKTKEVALDLTTAKKEKAEFPLPESDQNELAERDPGFAGKAERASWLDMAEEMPSDSHTESIEPKESDTTAQPPADVGADLDQEAAPLTAEEVLPDADLDMASETILEDSFASERAEFALDHFGGDKPAESSDTSSAEEKTQSETQISQASLGVVGNAREPAGDRPVEDLSPDAHSPDVDGSVENDFKPIVQWLRLRDVSPTTFWSKLLRRLQEIFGFANRVGYSTFEFDAVLMASIEKCLPLLISPTKEIDSVSSQVHDSDRLSIAWFQLSTKLFSGHIVAVHRQSAPAPRIFMDHFQREVVHALSVLDPSGRAGKVAQFKIRKTDVERWLNVTASIKASISAAPEVDIDFALISGSTDEQFQSEQLRPEPLADLDCDESIDYDLFLHLPKNEKYLRYVKRGDHLIASDKKKLLDHGTHQVHLKFPDPDSFAAHLAKRSLNNLIATVEQEMLDRASGSSQE